MKKTLLVLESEANYRNKILTSIKECNLNMKVITADSLSLAYKAALEQTIDVFLVDAIVENENPTNVSGIRFVEKIRQTPKYKLTPVIFISALEDPMLYAYKELNCIGFLKKPYKEKEFKSLLDKASFYTTKRSSENTLLFRKSGILYPVKIADIIYIERIDKLMHIHCVDGSVLQIPYKTYKQILEEADSDSLMLCSRSTLVNKEYILGVDIPNRYIILKDDRGMLDIGITYKNKIMEEFKH